MIFFQLRKTEEGQEISTDAYQGDVEKQRCSCFYKEETTWIDANSVIAGDGSARLLLYVETLDRQIRLAL